MSGVTRFGLQIPNFTYPGVSDRDLFARVADIAGAAEESGLRLRLGHGPPLPDRRRGPAGRPHARGVHTARGIGGTNLFGDLETVRHKLEVLDRHCEAVGRDPATITKAREIATARGTDDERFRATTTVGDPDAVCEEVRAYLDAGLDGLVFNMYDAHELDPVRLAWETLTAAFPVAQEA